MGADGTWNLALKTPMGDQSVTLVIESEGSSLTGKLVTPQGEMAIGDGTADGDSLSWTAEMTEPMAMKLEFTAQVDGDAISGDAKLGSFGNATFSGNRA